MAVFMTGMLFGVIIQACLRLWTKYRYFSAHGEKPESANVTLASVSIMVALIGKNKKYSIIEKNNML